jgi:hypothetical protein
MEENTATIDIRAINEKLKRECFYWPSDNGDEQSDCWSEAYGQVIANRSLEVKGIFY